jgi:diguanylate cyclase (GGDEF)-like protein
VRNPFAVLVIVLVLGPLVSQSRAQAALSSQPGQIAITPLKTVAEIRALRPDQVAAGLPVELHAVLTYYVPAEGQIFAQDNTGGIYIVAPPHAPQLRPGDVVVIRGTTVPSFAANVQASEIVVQGRNRFPDPVPVTWRDLWNPAYDCRFVSLTGIVRSATQQVAHNSRPVAQDRRDVAGGARRQEPASEAVPANPPLDPYMLMDVRVDGGFVRVHMEKPQGIDPLSLLDAQVRLEGVAGGIFDGKFQQTGAELWVASGVHLQMLRPAGANPANLPLTGFARIMSHSDVHDESERVHVRGSVTFYQPGLQLVVETPDHAAALVNTYEEKPLRIGQIVDVVGFPDAQEYSEVIKQGNVLPSPQIRSIEPVPIPWAEALSGHHPFELVSMEGRLAAEVHEQHQDTLIIQSGSHVYSAILPRTVWDQDFDQLTLPDYRIGSKLRVTGVCFVHAGGPWNTERWFDVQLRTPGDVMVVAEPSWWTVRHLLYLSAALLGLVMAAFLWAVFLHRKVRRQTDQIRHNIEAEAARERRTALLEAERARVLEAINSTRSLDEVLEMILSLIGRQLHGRTCWCELTSGTRVGQGFDAGPDRLLIRREIFSGAGERLGSLLVADTEGSNEFRSEVMEIGASLAALAIDNRRLYETLVHRSQYDQLTNTANRFLLESRLDEALTSAACNGTRCALVYIDLDEFKKVNDVYGHRGGDFYLQQVAQRFSEKLRGMDTLARVGGDEFIVLIPLVRSRAEVEEIVQRLVRCFDLPFLIDGHLVSGSASIGFSVYPEDGATKEELKRLADTAMYEQKASFVK